MIPGAKILVIGLRDALTSLPDHFASPQPQPPLYPPPLPRQKTEICVKTSEIQIWQLAGSARVTLTHKGTTTEKRADDRPVPDIHPSIHPCKIACLCTVHRPRVSPWPSFLFRSFFAKSRTLSEVGEREVSPGATTATAERARAAWKCFDSH